MTMINQNGKITYITDVASVEADDSCGMKYWFRNHEGGNGILHKDDLLTEKILEQSITDLRTVAMMDDIRRETVQAAIDEVLADLTEDDKKDHPKMELLYRRLGWLAAFAIFVEPVTHNVFEEIPIDDEIWLNRDPLMVKIRPGRVLKDRFSKQLVYREFIPTGTTGNRWLDHWQYNIRLHLGITAAAEHLNERIVNGQVMGMDMGYRSGSAGKLYHPYVYGFYNKKTNVWMFDGIGAERTGSGWVERPVWEFEKGIVQWVINCGEKVAISQFQLSPGVKIDPNLVRSWTDQRLHRERMNRGLLSTCQTNFHIRSAHFPRRTAQCRPILGDSCPFLQACWQVNAAKPEQVVETVKNIYVVKKPVVETIVVGGVVA